MSEDFIKIEVNGYGIKHSAMLPDSCDANDFIEICAMMAESLGFSPELVINALKESTNNRI